MRWKRDLPAFWRMQESNMSTEKVDIDTIEIDTIDIDTREVASKLSFLVGRTILFRDGHEDATTASTVLAVKAENTSGEEEENGHHPQVAIYTTVGVLTIKHSSEFNNIMLLDGKSIGAYADNMGIYF